MAMNLGKRILPPRFLLFILVAVVAAGAGVALFGPAEGFMAGFDLAATVFLLSCIPLLGDDAGKMREAAERNDANRVTLLGITSLVTIVVLVSVATELSRKEGPDLASIVLIVGTLAIAWLFSNMIYALHYAHIFYLRSDDGDGDRGGIDIPATDEPCYWDFVYFAFTLGMTFQTSDVEIQSPGIRKVAIFHCLAAFVFNIGVLAFTINVLGGSGT